MKRAAVTTVKNLAASASSSSAAVKIPGSIQTTKDGKVRLIIQAKPGARISAITDISEESIGVAIAAPPRDGEANEELINFLAKILCVKKRELELAFGGKSRHKSIVVQSDECLDQMIIHKRLQEACRQE